ncbi:hypothetical protein ACQP2U_43645 (plasmid) [Nocardia sp. CA-084685]|uniref:hypothetical protein n=1 Tax=Nocardia sp. CA-084685 TaxID=3239970 RepID=UPI003D96450F
MMIGDYTSMAEVDGQYRSPLTFTPGVDFDPYDPEEVEIVMEASEWSVAARMRHLEAENARLRAELAELDED